MIQRETLRIWVLELAGLKGAKIHTPWMLSPVSHGENYLRPIVNPPEWSRHTPKVNGTGRAKKAQHTWDRYLNQPCTYQ